MSLNRFHKRNWERSQAGVFGTPHTRVELVACIAEEVGELADAVLRMENVKHVRQGSRVVTREDVLDAVADAMTYLSLVAASYGETDLESLLINTFNYVSARAGRPEFVIHNDM